MKGSNIAVAIDFFQSGEFNTLAFTLMQFVCPNRAIKVVPTLCVYSIAEDSVVFAHREIARWERAQDIVLDEVSVNIVHTLYRRDR